MNVSELIESIGEERNRLNKLYSEYKNGMIELSKQKELLKNMLQENGLRSAKSASFGVSIAIKPNLNVISEQSVKEWLNNTPNIESDAYIGLKLSPFKAFAIGYLKETGELIDGVEYGHSESISIKNNAISRHKTMNEKLKHLNNDEDVLRDDEHNRS